MNDFSNSHSPSKGTTRRPVVRLAGSRTFALLLCVGIFVSFVSDAASQINYATPYTFATFAGNADPQAGPPKDGVGLEAHFLSPGGMVADSAGNIYVIEGYNQSIRKISPDAVVSTFVGGDSQGHVDGQGRNARFQSLSALAADISGNLYVTDANCVRKITSSGSVSTVAGDYATEGNVDGAASNSRFRKPRGVAVDPTGAIFVADTGNQTIRKISPDGIASTIAGTPNVIGTADGKGSTATFHFPQGVAVDASGNIFIADTDNCTIRKITPSGLVSTLAGDPLSGDHQSDGTGAAGHFNFPEALAINSGGDLYVADTSNNAIRKISPSGVVSTLAGYQYLWGDGSTDGAGRGARFNHPEGIAVRSDGVIFVADSWNRTVRRVTATGTVSTWAGTPPSPGFADGTGSSARFAHPEGIAIDSFGNLLVCDSDNFVVRKVDPNGTVATVAGQPETFKGEGADNGLALEDRPHGIVFDSKGSLYFSISSYASGKIMKITPGGTLSVYADLGSRSAEGITIDQMGTMFATDPVHNLIYKISPQGTVSQFAGSLQGHADGVGSAAQFNYPVGIVVDTAGNLFVADSDNSTIRKISPDGTVVTFAGTAKVSGSKDGPIASSLFSNPTGLAIDKDGNLYVTELSNLVRRISAAGEVTTLAGWLGSPEHGDGTGSQARFSYPRGIAVTSTGQLYVADSENSTIRVGKLIVPTAPEITMQPVSQTVSAGAKVVFTVSAVGSPDSSYAWQVSSTDGTSWAWLSESGTFSGTNTATLTISKPDTALDGSRYRCIASNSLGSATSSPALLTVVAERTRLVNISTRAYCSQGNAITIGGFVIEGPGSKKVLVRAVGPTLATQGLSPSEVLQDPTFDIYRGSSVIASNDNWTDNSNQSELTAVGSQIGANPLAATDVTSSAKLLSVEAGVYTFVAKGRNEGAGVVLLEVYDADPSNAAIRFVNISSRAFATTGSGVTIGGFVIAGRSPKRILMRAIGPTLASQGIAQNELLKDPSIELHQGSSIIAANDNWTSNLNTDEIATTSTRIGAAPISGSDTKSSALLKALEPGAYTFIAQEANAGSGIVLVEVYDAD